MKTPSISLKRSLEVTMNDALKRLEKLSELDEKALNDEYREWIEASEGEMDHPQVLYINYTNIE
tara:strand:+ start:293 stop:484 length:192 start_codon:yes stop_codon:yes gene_type:complete